MFRAAQQLFELELGKFSSPEKFAQCWIVTWICDFGIKGIFDKIEKSG